jgi:hypothetical protein
MKDPIFMPPKEYILDWAKELFKSENSKGEITRTIARRAASWAFNKGIETGRAIGAAQELNQCCAQINQCSLIPAELRSQVAKYLYEIRVVDSEKSSSPCALNELN